MAAKGGLATTWNGRRGNHRSAASASTTTAQPAEPLPEDLGAPRVQLDGDDARTRVDERRGECTRACTHVDDQIAAPDSAVGDESFSPAWVELMPPPPPWLSHGDGPLS